MIVLQEVVRKLEDIRSENDIPSVLLELLRSTALRILPTWQRLHQLWMEN